MGTRYLIDTNAVIDYLNNNLPETAGLFLDGLMEINLSIITRIELLAWKNASKEQTKVLETYISHSSVLNLSEQIIENTIDIRKHYHIKLPDAIIAATAVTHGFTLITRNISDFNKISHLLAVNPYELK